MFEDLQAIAGIVGGIGVMALAALYLIINRSPNGEGRRRRDAQNTIHNLESKMDIHQTKVEAMMEKHIESGDKALGIIDGKIDTINGHIIDHLRDHSNN